MSLPAVLIRPAAPADLEAIGDDRDDTRAGRYTEPFALLVAQLAYEGTEGPELAYRFEWLG